MPNNKDMERIAEVYSKYNTLSQTANYLGISVAKVRKVLITLGLYETEMSKKINRLYDAGKTIDEIALEVGCSTKCVNGYLPYSKCLYGSSSPTQNALKLRIHRNRPLIF